MADQPILAQVAERYGLTVKTVTRRIREHPELGVVIEPKKAPELDENQVSQLCAILDRRYGERAAVPDEATGQGGRVSKTVQELENELAQVRTDLEVAKARLEERQRQMEFILSQNERIPLLEAAAEERQREIGDLRSEVAEARGELAAAREEWKSKGLLDRLFRR